MFNIFFYQKDMNFEKTPWQGYQPEIRKRANSKTLRVKKNTYYIETTTRKCETVRAQNVWERWFKVV